MADYLSKFTGQQVDTAVSVALDFSATSGNYITKDDINTLVPGLTNGAIDVAQLPVATKNAAGVISVGGGLQIESGALTIDSAMYYTKSELDVLLDGKLDRGDLNMPDKLSQFTNDIISVNRIEGSNFRLTIK